MERPALILFDYVFAVDHGALGSYVTVTHDDVSTVYGPMFRDMVPQFVKEQQAAIAEGIARAKASQSI